MDTNAALEAMDAIIATIPEEERGAFQQALAERLGATAINAEVEDAETIEEENELTTSRLPVLPTEAGVEVFNQDVAIEIMKQFTAAVDLSNEQKARITANRVQMVLRCANNGLLKSKQDVVEVMDVFTEYGAHPTKVTGYLRKGLHPTTIGFLYSARDELQVDHLDGILVASKLLGLNLSDDYDMRRLDEMLNERVAANTHDYKSDTLEARIRERTRIFVAMIDELGGQIEHTDTTEIAPDLNDLERTDSPIDYGEVLAELVESN